MPQYMLLIYSDPAERAAHGPEDEMPLWNAIGEELGASGQLMAGHGLQPAETATTVRVRDGERLLTDGPFAETRELLGGYWVIDAPDLDAALDWAAKMPNVGYGSVEVRPLMVFPDE